MTLLGSALDCAIIAACSVLVATEGRLVSTVEFAQVDQIRTLARDLFQTTGAMAYQRVDGSATLTEVSHFLEWQLQITSRTSTSLLELRQVQGMLDAYLRLLALRKTIAMSVLGCRQVSAHGVTEQIDQHSHSYVIQHIENSEVYQPMLPSEAQHWRSWQSWTP
jgi:predicted GNAT family N-acyltransferase